MDEFRLTIAGQLCGPFNTHGEIRPGVFHLPESMHYLPENNPIISYDGIRVFGRHHLFIRGSFVSFICSIELIEKIYRHNMEEKC